MIMRLHAGRVGMVGNTEITLNDLPTVDFPIIELDPAAYGVEIGNIVTSYNYSVTTESGTVNIKSISFSGSNNEIYDTSGNLSLLLTDAAPKFCTDAGNIITTQGGFVDTGNPRYEIPDLTFDAVPLGARPDDFGLNRCKYYLKQDTSIGSKNITAPLNYYSAIGTRDFNGYKMTNYSTAVFNNGVQYYKINNNDLTKDLCQVFTADNGTMFGVGKICSYRSNGVWHWSTFAGCIDSEGSQVVFDCCFYWHTYGFDDEHNISPTAGNAPRRIYIEYDGRDRTVNPNIPWVNNKTCMFFASVVYNDITYTGIVVVENSDDTENAIPIRAKMTLFSPEFWGDAVMPDPEPEEDFGDDNDTDGGQGYYDITSDDRGDGTGADFDLQIQLLNTASEHFCATGAINVYRVDGTGGSTITLSAIIQKLYSSDFITRFGQSLYNPLSSIIASHLIPQQLTSATGEQAHVTAGGYDISDHMTGTPTCATAKQFTHLHLGTIDITKYTDSFADYAPYTSAKLHLPYCGVIDIDINKCMRGKLSVDYICDCISGNVAAIVWLKDFKTHSNYIYNATGNAAYSFPMFAENQSGQAVGKIIGAVSNTIVGAATGNPFSIAGAVSAGIDAVTTGHNTQINGVFSGNVGAISDTVCYLEISRPKWVNPKDFKKLKGLTSHLSGCINDAGNEKAYTGYIKVSDCILSGIDATDAEIKEIETLLKNGIFVVQAGEEPEP